MNQLELNNVAQRFIQIQSAEVTVKLNKALAEDAEERSKVLSGPPLHYVHNMAIFNCLASLNAMFFMDNDSAEAAHQYSEYAETLRPKFIGLMEELKDFRPQGLARADDTHKE